MLDRRLFVLFAGVLAGCPAEEVCAPFVATSDVECQLTADCVEAGFATLTCVSGVCRRTCVADDDCVIDVDTVDDACRSMNDPQPETPICEAQLCVTGCPSVPCGAGETCVNGRCAYDFESFEIPPDQDFVDLRSIGFTLDTELTNPATAIAFLGRPGCALGDALCAGPARTGERFALVKRAPTPVKGVADTAFTCRSCACCLDCILNPPPMGENASIPVCPGVPGRLWSLPQPLMCPAMPAECSAVCTACDSCPMAVAGTVGERLASCEVDAAERGCAKCQQCDTFVDGCRTAQCGGPCANPNSAECSMCVQNNCLNNQDCIDCRICSDAADCELAMVGTAECANNRAACNALGEDGCYPTPANYPRAQLTDEEQALTSREIDISGAAGDVIIQLDYVPFDVGLTYKVGQQGVDPATWPTEDQEVIVQLCAANCSEAASWSDATLVGGERAVIPPASRRQNGLTIGNQSALDWEIGRLSVAVPAAMKSATFRYRFLPRLSDDAAIGVDDIIVRPAQ